MPDSQFYSLFGNEGLQQQSPGEAEYFDTYSATFQGGSPVSATFSQPGTFGGPRFNAFFNPAGTNYSSIGDSSDITYHRIVDAFNQQRLFTDQSYGAARAGLDSQIDTIRSGYEEAQGYVDDLGRASRRRALDREQQLGAQLQARAGGRTYAADFATRGLASDTTRLLQEIDAGLANTYAGLITQRTGAEAGVMGARASSYLDQASVYQSLLAQQFSLLGGYAPDPGRDRSGLFSLIGGATQAIGYGLGGLVGGPAGAAVGGAAASAVGPQSGAF